MLGFHWVAGVSPGIVAYLQCPDVLVASLQKLLRQTGAGSFLGSIAIVKTGLFLAMSDESDSNSLRGMRIASGIMISDCPRLGVANIDDGEGFAGVDASSEFLRRDSGGFCHCELLPLENGWELGCSRERKGRRMQMCALHACCNWFPWRMAHSIVVLA